MKRIFYCFVFLFLVGSCRGQKLDTRNPKETGIRAPAFAGQFYPADSLQLTAAIRAFLADAKPPSVHHPVAIIVPHAGYIYSGQIAADGYNQARGNSYDLIVVLGTNHTTAGFTGMSVYPKGAFGTPIGAAAVDDSAAKELAQAYPRVTTDGTAHEREHSIEVQIPFIKYLFPHAEILPIIVSETDAGKCEEFGKALAAVLKNNHALIVASSDLSHYPQFDDAIRIDEESLKAIASLDVKRIQTESRNMLDRNISRLVTCACGEAPIMVAVAAAKEMGADHGTIISYSNSGCNPVGRVDRVVGYGAIAIGTGETPAPVDPDTMSCDSSYTLDSAAKAKLLKYARKTLEQMFTTGTVPLPRGQGIPLNMKRGVFVTLRKNGELRGCIGDMSGDRPLGTAVGAMALQAAFNDTRFRPVTEQELSQIEIEISVLTPFKEVKSADDIVLGRDGVIVRKGNRQAVFLPQVATETGWSKQVFLDQLCYKAGLQAGDWKNAQLFTFQAVVFSESEVSR